jgi:hypothetical protein
LASVRSHLQHHLNTVKGRPYRRHIAGQGKAYRLRGGLPEESSADLSPSLCGKDGQYQLREGQENAAFTTRGLDSSFAASIASTTLDGDRNGEGEGEGERGTSGYAEEDGKLEEAGSSIGGGRRGLASVGASGTGDVSVPLAAPKKVPFKTQPTHAD